MICPRCGTLVEQEFYGPCPGCVVELRVWANIRAATRRMILWLTNTEE